MFGWFSKACPVDAPSRAWIESRWRWLTDQFGGDTMLDTPTILPTKEFFPDPYDASEAAGRTTLNRVCGYMGADPEKIELQYYSNNRHALSPAGYRFLPPKRPARYNE
jgi:hypothetical protein